MTANAPEVPSESDVDVCEVCSSVIRLAGLQHLVWDRRIEALYAGTETFETLDADSMTALPDGIPLRAPSGKWMSVSEVREHYGEGDDLFEVIEEFGHAKPYTAPVNDPEANV